MRRVSIFTALLSGILLLSSCTPAQSIEKLAVAVAGGYDLTPEGKYMVTKQILRGSSSSQGPGAPQVSSSISEIVVYTALGETPSDAIYGLSKEISRTIYLAQSRYKVIGESLAKNGLRELVDFEMRQYQMRPSTPLFVTKGMATDILSITPPDESVPANSLENIYMRQRLLGFAPVVTAVEFANSVASAYEPAILGVVEVSRGNPKQSETFRVAGTAVFKGDKLIGYLNDFETRGMQWVKGKVKDGLVSSPYGNNKRVSTEIITSHSKIKPVIKGNSITIRVNVFEEGNITELPSNIDIMKNPEALKELEALQGSAIKSEIEQAIYAAQKELGADVFGFGEEIHRKYPGEWKNLEKNWWDIFPNINIEVTVNSKIRRVGKIGKPLL